MRSRDIVLYSIAVKILLIAFTRQGLAADITIPVWRFDPRSPVWLEIREKTKKSSKIYKQEFEPIGLQHTATIQDLKPGHYQIKVGGISIDGCNESYSSLERRYKDNQPIIIDKLQNLAHSDNTCQHRSQYTSAGHIAITLTKVSAWPSPFKDVVTSFYDSLTVDPSDQSPKKLIETELKFLTRIKDLSSLPLDEKSTVSLQGINMHIALAYESLYEDLLKNSLESKKTDILVKQYLQKSRAFYQEIIKDETIEGQYFRKLASYRLKAISNPKKVPPRQNVIPVKSRSMRPPYAVSFTLNLNKLLIGSKAKIVIRNLLDLREVRKGQSKNITANDGWNPLTSHHLTKGKFQILVEGISKDQCPIKLHHEGIISSSKVKIAEFLGAPNRSCPTYDSTYWQSSESQ